MEKEPQTLQPVVNLVLAGLNTTDLGAVFGVSMLEMQRRIAAAGVLPSGTRRERPIYTIPDVSPLFVKPNFDIERYIKGLKAKDLPATLQRAFWAAQESRQRYDELAGNLWRTERVQVAVGRFIMIVRQRLVLATDQVDRMAPLTDEQRVLVQNLFDDILIELQASVVKEFADYSGKGDRQPLWEDGPPLTFVDGLE